MNERLDYTRGPQPDLGPRSPVTQPAIATA